METLKIKNQFVLWNPKTSRKHFQMNDIWVKELQWLVLPLNSIIETFELIRMFVGEFKK